MKPSINSNDLKTAISSTLRRQHLLGASPGAQRLIPLAACVVGDYIARKSTSGENVIENFLSGASGKVEDSIIAIANHPADSKVLSGQQGDSSKRPEVDEASSMERKGSSPSASTPATTA